MHQIPSKFLRDSVEVLALPLRNIINLSIKLSTFPEEYKIAKLKPIFKKGARTDPKNYRSISLLPLVSKTIEKSIHFQVEYYLNNEKNNLHHVPVRLQDEPSNRFLFVSAGMNKQMHIGMILIDL